MKLFRLTKQRQNKIAEKTSLISAKLLILLALFLIPALTFATSLDDQINQTEQNLSQTKSTKKTLSGEVAAFDSQIGNIQSQINATDTDLTKTKNEITETNNQIKQAEADLAKTKDQLREYVRTMYEEGQVSNIELIAKSKSFSEFVDRNEYMQTMQLKIKEASDKIVALKSDLEKKKKSLEEKQAKIEQLKKDQVLQRSALDTQRAAKNTLLTKTKGDEKYFQNTLGSLYAQRAALSSSNNEGSGGGGAASSYPYRGSCGGVDPWLFYKCQCTSYAAWKWNAVYGKPWRNTRPGQGDAGNWAALARDQGYSVSSTPSVGAIMVFPFWSVPGGYGHVAIVESVNGNGTVNVSEYNWSVPEGPGTRSGVNPWNYGASFIK